MTTKPPSADQLTPMSLLDQFVPGLQAGLYRLTIEQSLDLGVAPSADKGPSTSSQGASSASQPLGSGPRTYARNFEFRVRGPRFHLPKEDVHACSPPPGATGAYDEILPHLVATKRALPWERELVKGQAVSGGLVAPWLALLVFSHDELTQPGAGPISMSAGELMGVGKNPTVTKMVNGESKTVFLPALADDEADDPSTIVNALDLPFSLFSNVAPKVDSSGGELVLLSHVRQVDTDGKVPLPTMPVDGEFSVVVGNRFPPAGTAVAHLVSLEGWFGLLESLGSSSATNSRKIGPGDLVRLVSLYHWGFVNDSHGLHTFGQLARGLDVDAVGTPDGALASQIAALGSADAGTANRLTQGYRPIDYKPRESSGSFAWYRGPLSPVPTAPLGGDTPFLHADAALVLDEATGVVDVSYAAAWQFGRMLALSSPSFVRDVLAIRSLDPASDPWAVTSLEAWLANHQTQVLEERATLGEISNGGTTTAATGTESLAAGGTSSTAGHSTPAGGATASTAALTTSTPAEISSTAGEAIAMVEWLARLALLYPVPFHYLVADDSLLPKESLRFFHLDSNWLESLIEGALSIGVHCSADRQAQADQRPQIRQAVSQVVARYRWWLRDQGRGQIIPQSELSSDGDLLDGKVSGFLLRSELVNGWPGIEIDVSTVPPPPAPPTFVQKANGSGDVELSAGATSATFREPVTTPATILRWDHVGPGTLLCLVHGTVAKVTLKEPREHLRLGLDDDSILLRQLSGEQIGAPLLDGNRQEIQIQQVQETYERTAPATAEATTPPSETQLPVSDGVLDIKSLVQEIGSMITDYPATSSAAFGLQLIRSPEERELWWVDPSWRT